jgi:uncharacterized membrane protein
MAHLRRQKMSEKKSSTGLESNIGGLLSYLVGWITGLIFFLIEQEDEYVRYHAMQSIIFFGAITVIQIVLIILAFIPYIGLIFLILQYIVWLFAVVMWIILMVRAYQGARIKLPIAGSLAEKYSAKR